jgi:hypothetical protein
MFVPAIAYPRLRATAGRRATATPSDLFLRAFAVGRKTPLFNRLLEPPGVFVVGRAVTTAIPNFFCIVGFSFSSPNAALNIGLRQKFPRVG